MLLRWIFYQNIYFSIIFSAAHMCHACAHALEWTYCCGILLVLWQVLLDERLKDGIIFLIGSTLALYLYCLVWLNQRNSVNTDHQATRLLAFHQFQKDVGDLNWSISSFLCLSKALCSYYHYCRPLKRTNNILTFLNNELKYHLITISLKVHQPYALSVSSYTHVSIVNIIWMDK